MTEKEKEEKEDKENQPVTKNRMLLNEENPNDKRINSRAL